MRHRKTGRKLNRNSSQRGALMKGLAISIIEHESVKTTLAKAKEIRGFLEPLVTLAKKNTVSNQRLAYSRLQSKEAVAKLFDELGPRYTDRPGGYLRIIKRGFRPGDKSPSAQIEFVISEVDSIQEKTTESEEVTVNS
jgi:large subunit ribosomal protein L17